MSSQLTMTPILDELDDAWHKARAIKPTRWEPCNNCDRLTLVGENDPRPWLCGYCRAEQEIT